MSVRLARHLVIAAAVPTLILQPLEAQDFTLQQIMSSPFPGELVAAPTGGAVAWVQNAEGVRNIWMADAPAYGGRQLTSYSEDDGQAISNLQFTPDGRAVVFVRGGAPNRQSEIPNPLSDPDAAERAIWIVPVEGDEPTLVAEGSSPAISPDGELLVFPKQKQVWAVGLDGSRKSAEQLFEIRGTVGALRWSPDGRMLAFVSNRGDHSFVGVFSREDRSIKYMDPSVDRDGRPVWSLDGRRIAFIRIPQQSGFVPFMARRQGMPWSIRVADVASGHGRSVWIADEGRGSIFRGVVARDQLFWGSGDVLVFPWEREGWTHLYSVPIDGGNAIHLTPGAFEVEDVALRPDRTAIVYSSNHDDIDRRHVWRVPVGGGTPRAVTTGAGIEWSPVVAADENAIAFLASDARHPAHAQIKVGSDDPRAMAASSLPSDFPLDDLVVPQQVIFPGADGMMIHGQLFLPPDLRRRGERRPGVLFFHGGSRRQMLLGWHYRGYYHNAYALNQYLANNGYIVLSVNYRSGIGYGLEFREALNYGARGASEFNDVVGAGLYLQNRDDVDPDRIGLWGGSYGGYLTALGLARASDLFAAGVDIHGVHDWNIVIRNFQQSYNPLENEAGARLAFESSPMASVKDWRSPVLLIHGDDDRNVPFSETVDLVEQLRKYGVDFEQLIFPDEVHGFLLHRNWLAAYRATADFFDSKLKGRQVAAGGGGY